MEVILCKNISSLYLNRTANKEVKAKNELIWPAFAWQTHPQENASENWAIQGKQKWGPRKNID